MIADDYQMVQPSAVDPVCQFLTKCDLFQKAHCPPRLFHSFIKPSHTTTETATFSSENCCSYMKRRKSLQF